MTIPLRRKAFCPILTLPSFQMIVALRGTLVRREIFNTPRVKIALNL
jgi:hypothetical protein